MCFCHAPGNAQETKESKGGQKSAACRTAGVDGRRRTCLPCCTPLFSFHGSKCDRQSPRRGVGFPPRDERRTVLLRGIFVRFLSKAPTTNLVIRPVKPSHGLVRRSVRPPLWLPSLLFESHFSFSILDTVSFFLRYCCNCFMQHDCCNLKCTQSGGGSQAARQATVSVDGRVFHAGAREGHDHRTATWWVLCCLHI